LDRGTLIDAAHWHASDHISSITTNGNAANLGNWLAIRPSPCLRDLRVHPKAMPVILTTSEEHDVWLRVLGPRPRRYRGCFRTVY
jgi:hypothetical protein